MSSERRQLRTPVALYASEIGARNTETAFITSLSLNGLFGHALSRPWARAGKRSLIELPLPGEAEALRLIVELVHENHGPLFRETAMRFVDVPNQDRERLNKWLVLKQQELEQIDTAILSS